jgi:prophage regulatory protein
MKRKDIVEATGLCYTTIYNLEKNGNFPARRKLSASRVAWMRDEVTAWLVSRLSVVAKPLIDTFDTLACSACSSPCPLDTETDSIIDIPVTCSIHIRMDEEDRLAAVA